MTNGKKIVIFGTGKLAEVAHYYFTHDSPYEVVAFAVDREFLQSNEFINLPVIPFEEVEKRFPPDQFSMFIAVGYGGMNKVRAKKYGEAKRKGYKLASYVCSKSVIWDNVKIGDNCFIFENQTIQPFAKIGNDVIIWSGNHIGHHSSIGDHCFITSHVVVSGNVAVGDYCFLGVNATIRDGIEIAPECLIGAGAVIMKSTKAKEVFIPGRTKPDERESDQFFNF
jgi:sugar O-acyltransferase (sialic acid O-acetyltransferase NeuD family)